MGTLRRRRHYRALALLRRLPAALPQALDHDDRLRADGRDFFDRSGKFRLLPRSLRRPTLRRRSEHDDFGRRRNRTLRISDRSVDRRTIWPRADGREFRHLHHGGSLLVFLGTARALRDAAAMSRRWVFLFLRFCQTPTPPPERPRPPKFFQRPSP